jgi:hypothetical protein
MDRFEVTDPVSHQKFEVRLSEVVAQGDRLDEYREATFASKDGVAFQTSFWRDPQERDGHTLVEPGMVLVPDLTTDFIRRAAEAIFREGSIAEALEPKDSI